MENCKPTIWNLKKGCWLEKDNRALNEVYDAFLTQETTLTNSNHTNQTLKYCAISWCTRTKLF